MIKAITICVGYDDYLRLTIPRIVKNVDKLLIVTTETDVRTHELADLSEKIQIYCTDAFYRNGAHFNKGLAMEEGFDILGREGWILILDADIWFPEPMTFPTLQAGRLYTPARRILSDVDGLTPEKLEQLNWKKLPLRQENGNFGYFQLFNAEDPAIQQLPWYDTDFNHAGGADSVFEKRWSRFNKMRMPFEVVHLGDPDANWYGRTRPRIDTGEVPEGAEVRSEMQEALHRKYGWKGRQKTGEPVVERISSTDGGPEVCHNHEAPAGQFQRVHRNMIVRRNGVPVVVPTPAGKKPTVQPPEPRLQEIKPVESKRKK